MRLSRYLVGEPFVIPFVLTTTNLVNHRMDGWMDELLKLNSFWLFETESKFQNKEV